MESIATTTLNPFSRLFAANTAAASITPPIATITQPTGDGVIDMLFKQGGQGLQNVALAFLGTGAATQTMTGRVTGWRLISSLWVPVPLLALAMTLGAGTGIAGGDVLNTEFFADTITASTSFTTANEIINPAATGCVGLVKLQTVGFRFIQVQLAKNTCTACNALGAWY